MSTSGAGIALLLVGLWLVFLSFFIVWKYRRERLKRPDPELPLLLYLLISGGALAIVELVAYRHKMRGLKGIQESVAVQEALQQTTSDT